MYVIRSLVSFKPSRFWYQKKMCEMVLTLAIKLILEERKDAAQICKRPLPE